MANSALATDLREGFAGVDPGRVGRGLDSPLAPDTVAHLVRKAVGLVREDPVAAPRCAEIAVRGRRLAFDVADLGTGEAGLGDGDRSLVADLLHALVGATVGTEIDLERGFWPVLKVDAAMHHGPC